MALIQCPECGKSVSDKASVCIHCGYPLRQLEKEKESDICYCPYCGKKNSMDASYCNSCGRSFKGDTESTSIVPVQNNSTDADGSTDIMAFKSNLDSQVDYQLQQVQIMQQRQYNAQAKCPRCGSTSLSAAKQGFGYGKAVAGAVVLGGIGLLAGGIGANKTVVTCLNCGYKFKI